MHRKAEAWKEFKDAAMLSMYLETLPKVRVSPPWSDHVLDL